MAKIELKLDKAPLLSLKIAMEGNPENSPQYISKFISVYTKKQIK